MLKSYLLLAIRNFYRNPTTSLISILSLALGIACCLLAARLAFYHLSWESGFNDSDELYSVSEFRKSIDSDNLEKLASVPWALGEQIVKNLPDGIESLNFPITHSFSILHVESMDYADKHIPTTVVPFSLFEILEFPVYSGSLKKFMEPNSAVVSKAMLEDVLDSAIDVGDLFELDGKSYTLVAILDDLNFPSWMASRFRFLHINTPSNPKIRPPFIGRVLLKVKSQRHVEALDGYLKNQLEMFQQNPAYQEPPMANFVPTKLVIEPMYEVHMGDKLLRSGGTIWFNSWPFVQVMGALAFLVLILAIINISNISSAQQIRRQKEVALRKTFGAKRQDVNLQFFVDMLLRTLIASTLGILISLIATPWFSEVTSYGSRAVSLSSFSLPLWPMFGFLLGVVITTTLLSSVYPSLLLGRLSPLHIFQQNKSQSKNRLFKILVILQLCCTFLFVSLSSTVFLQARHQSKLDLGINLENTFNFWLSPASSKGFDPSKSTVLLEEIKKFPEVESIAAQILTIGIVFGSNIDYVKKQRDSDEHYNFHGKEIAPGLLDHYQISLAAGSMFDERHSFSNKDGGDIILTLGGLSRLGFKSPEEAIDQVIYSAKRPWGKPDKDAPTIEYHIVGVVNALPALTHDHSFYSNEIDVFIPGKVKGLSNIRYREGSFDSLKEKLKVLVDDIYGAGSEVHITPSNSTLLMTMNNILRPIRTISPFAIAATLIAFAGIYAMSLLAANRMKKVVGIRKVLGATRGMLVWHILVRESIPIVIALAIALPITYISCSKILEAQIDKFPMGIFIFVVVPATCLIVSWLTIIVQTWRVASTDPASVLSTE